MSDALENLVRAADCATSRELVSQIVRTAYALGRFEEVIEQTLTDASARRQELDRRREALS